MKIKLYISLAAAAVLLAACGKETATTATPSVSRNPAAPQTQAAATGSSSKPLTEYTELNSGRQLMAHFVSLKALTAEEWARAADGNEKIAREQDAFKRKDLIKQFQETVEAEAKVVAGQRYVYFDLPDLLPREEWSHLGEYNFDSKAFPVPFFASKKNRDKLSGQYVVTHSKLGFGDERFAGLDFTNGDQFAQLKVEEEALARTIESNRKKAKMIGGVMYRPDLRVRAYVFISGAQASGFAGNYVTGQIMKLQLRDPQGKVLVEF